MSREFFVLKFFELVVVVWKQKNDIEAFTKFIYKIIEELFVGLKIIENVINFNRFV